ncbi:MAG: OB-fold domain-containing protein [Chloroflexota bacterium]
MPKQSPVPDEISQPFWDACNEGRLVVQTCTACNRRQHPPQPKCDACGSDKHLEWRELSGKGKIHSYCTMYDSRIRTLREDQPFTIALIEMEEDPEIKMFSSLPGTPVDSDIPIGATVQVEFEETPATGQKVAEWRVVG